MSATTSATNSLAPGARLEITQALQSEDGTNALVMQPDGNLALYDHWQSAPRLIWSSGTGELPLGQRPTYGLMQDDGNFVLYGPNSDKKPIWETGTSGNPGSRLILQNDRNLVVVGSGGKTPGIMAPQSAPVWTSATSFELGLGPIQRNGGNGSGPPAGVLLRSQNDNVGNKKSMHTHVWLYRNGLLQVVVELFNGNWGSALRGVLEIIAVDASGQAIWVTNPRIDCPTMCAVSDLSCSSSRRWIAPDQSWPPAVAEQIADLQIFNGDAPSYRDILGEVLQSICRIAPGLPGQYGDAVRSMCKANGLG